MSLTLEPETIIEEQPPWTLAVNRHQNLLGKVVVVLQRPCARVVDLEPEEWRLLHQQIERVAVALDRLFQPDQVNLAFLMNIDPQVHLHVIPRYRSPRTWHGLAFDDPRWGEAAGPEQRMLGRPELEALATDIRAELPGPVAAT